MLALKSKDRKNNEWKQNKSRDHPLKIVCGWDECLQPVNPLIWYKLAMEKGWKIPKISTLMNDSITFEKTLKLSTDKTYHELKNTTIKEMKKSEAIKSG